jgi:hypothetical protein
MQQVKRNEVLVKSAILSAVSGLVLLGVLAALGITGNGRDPRAIGLMPEVVSVADRPRLVMDEVVVSAPNPNRLADAAARVSGIN